jgi:hypothetical protein
MDPTVRQELAVLVESSILGPADLLDRHVDRPISEVHGIRHSTPTRAEICALQAEPGAGGTRRWRNPALAEPGAASADEVG